MENSNMTDQTDETPSFASLPDLPLIKIFGFLNVRERFKVGRVCRGWYNVSKDSSLWKRMDVQNLGRRQFMKLLPAIPATVAHLRLTCKPDVIICKRLTHVLAILSKRCPSLNALTLSCRCIYDYTESSQIINRGPRNNANGSYLDYYTKESNKGEYVFMRELELISLGKTRFCLHEFSSFVDESVLPKLQVIDLTESKIESEEFVFFSRFGNLKELYLPCTYIKFKELETLLETAKALTVLDLEAVYACVRRLLQVLRQYGQSLEKLYFGMNYIQDKDLSDLLFAEANSFPHLVELCVRDNMLTDAGIQILLNSCSSLSRVDVTLCYVSKDWLRCSNERISGKVIFEEKAIRTRHYCHHFEKNHFPQVSTEPSFFRMGQY